MSDNKFVTFDFEASEKYRKTFRGRFWRLIGKIQRSIWIPRRIKGKIINFIQRGRYGIGYMDLWSADQYLAGVIARTLRAYAKDKNGVGYPYIEQNNNPDEAYKLLQVDYNSKAEMFEEYARIGYAHNEEWKKDGGLTKEELNEAFKWLADRFPSLWD